MNSMTGFGYAEIQNEKIHLTADLKSYNNRYLDLIINIPPPLNPLEPHIREKISQVIKRGRVELYLRMRELEEKLTIILDRDAAHSYADSLRELGRELDLKDELGFEQILSLEGVVKVDKKRDLDAMGAMVDDILDKALGDLVASRSKEGEATERDIMSQIGLIGESVDKIKVLAPEVESRVRETLETKFREILGDSMEETKILQETASYLVRYDINEEISRMESHLASFLSIAGKSGGSRDGQGAGQGAGQGELVGKKLDFLCQEMGREINTIGSKTPQVEVSRIVVEMKDGMEKIREQLRNVE